MILFLRKYWTHIAVVLALAVAITAIYQKGVSDAASRQTRKQLAAAIETIKVTKAAYAEDAKALITSKVREAELDAQIGELSEYVSDLEDANHECLSGADTDQLRKLWK
jgi:hypothetical protein